jgi:acetyltransferase-like isoleucine patch superfamily enzyme
MGPGFLIGNDVFIGPNVTVCNDMWPAVNKNGFDIAALQSGKWVVIIDDGACIGANAVVLPGVHIGPGAVIAAGAVVSRSVPPNRLYRRDGTIKIINGASRERRIREVTC